MDILYDKKVKCPVCNNEFTTKKVRVSKLRFIKQDTDFMPYYDKENPIKYNIFICPNCGYAATEDKFDSIPKRKKDIVLKEITLKWNKRNFGDKRTIEQAIETYKLAIYIGQLLDYSSVELGLLTLNLAWLFRLKGDEKQEMRFLRLTKSFFEDAYHKESLSNANMDEIKLAYLIGEINRRLGDKGQSVKWFNKVVTSHDNTNPAIKNMAIEQWRLAKEGE
jgi:uncharacterized protein (DUF2225 family)